MPCCHHNPGRRGPDSPQSRGLVTKEPRKRWSQCNSQEQPQSQAHIWKRRDLASLFAQMLKRTGWHLITKVAASGGRFGK